MAKEKVPILIIENNKSHLKLETIALANGKYSIQTAGSAEEVFNVLDQFQPKLILIEPELPDMDGLELIKQLKHHVKYQHIMIIAMTAHGMPDDKKAVLNAGCDGFISKPIDIEAFPQIVENYVK